MQKDFKKDDVIQQGDMGDFFYLLEEGTCEVYQKPGEEEVLVKRVRQTRTMPLESSPSCTMRLGPPLSAPRRRPRHGALTVSPSRSSLWKLPAKSAQPTADFYPRYPFLTSSGGENVAPTLSRRKTSRRRHDYQAGDKGDTVLSGQVHKAEQPVVISCRTVHSGAWGILWRNCAAAECPTTGHCGGCGAITDPMPSSKGLYEGHGPAEGGAAA